MIRGSALALDLFLVVLVVWVSRTQLPFIAYFLPRLQYPSLVNGPCLPPLKLMLPLAPFSSSSSPNWLPGSELVAIYHLAQEGYP